MSDACKAFISDDLLFKPGQKFEESANAYSVLGWLIESVTKKPFLQYAHERFRAWGLPDLDVENVAQSGFSRSEIYVVTNGRFRTAKRDDLSVLYPGAGLESSARDLALLGAKVLEGKIIERSFLDSVAWKPQSAGGKATGFALGWDVGMISGRRVVGRSGSLNGGSSQWWLYPDHNTIVVVLSNTRHEGTAPLARSIGDIALNDAANVPGRPFN